ncbi:hypothetical protein BH24GEM3_BH24GEM3_02150 [soil metagenome]|jgi:hypothetical protein
MRTESVNSKLAYILDKVAVAKQHVDEAMADADALPEEEGEEVQAQLGPVQNHLRAAVGSLKKYIEASPNGEPTG